MTARLLCVTVLTLSLPPVAMAQRGTADLTEIRTDALCLAEWQDAELRGRLCNEDLSERMLMALQKIERGRTHLDLKPAPTIVPGAGTMNEFIYVGVQLNIMCRGGTTGDDEKLAAVCAIRDRLDTVLTKRGFCYGMKGQSGANMRWHRCTAQSLR